MRGICTDHDLVRVASQLPGQIVRDEPLSFAIRYLSQYPSKNLSTPELQALSAASIPIVLVYEDGPTKPGYFSAERGAADGQRAADQARALGVPDGRPIYFAVDFDAETDAEEAIRDYFAGVAQGMVADGADYGIGAYASRAILEVLRDANLIDWFWQAGAPGWRKNGHKLEGEWELDPMPGRHLITIGKAVSVCGISCSPIDAAQDDFGSWQGTVS